MSLWLAVLSAFGIPGSSSADPTEDFRPFFDQNHDLILGYFRRKGVNPSISEELCQETFFRAYRRIDSYRGEAQPTTWLMAIAKNIWRNFLRDRATDKRSGEEISISAEHGELPRHESLPIEDVIGVEKRHALREAIRALPAGMRQCLLFRIYQDMSYKDIASMLEISVGSAKTQVSQARSRLKGILSDQYPELSKVLQAGEG